MVQSPSWAADWLAASQEIPRISRNPKVHYRTHKRPPPVPILGQPDLFFSIVTYTFIYLFDLLTCLFYLIIYIPIYLFTYYLFIYLTHLTSLSVIQII